MASQFDSWESYFYPDTIDPLTGIGTLRNLYDELAEQLKDAVDKGATVLAGAAMHAPPDSVEQGVRFLG